MTEFTFGAGIWAFGQIIDRYATDGYGPNRGMVEMLDLAKAVDGLECLDINVPFAEGLPDAAAVRSALDERGLRARAVTPHIYLRQFVRGAFTNPDPEIRKAVTRRVEEAVDAARILGADYVKFWPGQDGFDMPGQVDYPRLWDLTISGIRELATAHPDIQFAIEYKPKEPRVHITLADAAKTLLAISETGCDNVGIVLDFGHSLLAGEAPAEALQLVHRHGRLVSAELNDNWRGWDDDLPVAAVHLFETIEFILALRKIGWDKPLLLDQFPFREDPVAALSHSIRKIKLLTAACDELDLAALDDARERQDAMAAQEILWSVVRAASAAG